MFVAHVNADVVANGVNAALADLFGLIDPRPVVPTTGQVEIGVGRVAELAQPMTVAELTAVAAKVLPPTRWGVRAADDPDQLVRRLAVIGGSGAEELDAARMAGADAILTADIKHHLANEHILAGGPPDHRSGHWAAEWPWLPRVSAALHERLAVEAVVSRRCTDAWSVHVSSTMLGNGTAG